VFITPGHATPRTLLGFVVVLLPTLPPVDCQGDHGAQSEQGKYVRFGYGAVGDTCTANAAWLASNSPINADARAAILQLVVFMTLLLSL
jgi:hypothetical protein